MTVGGNHERDWPDSGDRYGDVLDSGAQMPRQFWRTILHLAAHCKQLCIWAARVACAASKCGVLHQQRFKLPVFCVLQHGPVLSLRLW